MKVLLSLLTLLLLAVVLQPARAQIPNAGFETWTNSTTPVDWGTDNVQGVGIPVTQSSDRRSGSFAAQGEVVSYLGNPYPPLIASGQFPIGQRYTSLSGYYKFAPVGGDVIGVIVYMIKNASPIGIGGGVDGTAYSTFTQVTIPIMYQDSTTVPDSAWIQISIGADTVTGLLHTGSTFIVDDLSFGGASAVNELPGVPNEYRLAQNYPNPFNPSTRIEFSIPRESNVLLKVYNLLGEEVATLVDEHRTAGNYSVDMNAARLTTGVYYYTLTAGSYVQTRKMVLMK